MKTMTRFLSLATGTSRGFKSGKGSILSSSSSSSSSPRATSTTATIILFGLVGVAFSFTTTTTTIAQNCPSGLPLFNSMSKRNKRNAALALDQQGKQEASKRQEQQQPRRKSSRLAAMSSSSSTKAAGSYMEALSNAASESLGREVSFEAASGGGFSGGGGASTSAVRDSNTGKKYFVKAASSGGGGADMLRAEYLGVRAMSETNTIRLPTPVAYGQYENRAFAVFEYLNFAGRGSQYELGRQLARMHRAGRSGKGFGFDVDNTIGATPQPNLPWMNDWADFWDEHRLGHMLKLTGNANESADTVAKLRAKTRELLSHDPEPSLVHGDLWGGNKGFVTEDDSGEVVPVIFDPATYYGDREVDVAMTYLFGGFNADFYRGYEDEWPLPPGHEKRRTVYNLYHILNHDVLFGGMYLNQARGMISQILKY